MVPSLQTFQLLLSPLKRNELCFCGWISVRGCFRVSKTIWHCLVFWHCIYLSWHVMRNVFLFLWPMRMSWKLRGTVQKSRNCRRHCLRMTHHLVKQTLGLSSWRIRFTGKTCIRTKLIYTRWMYQSHFALRSCRHPKIIPWVVILDHI